MLFFSLFSYPVLSTTHTLFIFKIFDFLMIFMMLNNHKKGFIALIAIVLLVSGILAFSLSVAASAVAYADRVYRRELRIQLGLYVESCRDSIIIMLKKDNFLKGEVHIGEFGCIADVQNDYMGTVSISATSSLAGVRAHIDYTIE
jgi:hypothetical protein